MSRSVAALEVATTHHSAVCNPQAGSVRRSAAGSCLSLEVSLIVIPTFTLRYGNCHVNPEPSQEALWHVSATARRS